MNRKIALVTGAAKGLGKAIAQLLSQEGAHVIIADIDEEGGKAAAEDQAFEGREGLFVHLDVAKPEDWARAADTVLQRFGKLDVLVNNAGVAIAASVENTTLEDWRWLMSVNLDGVFLGIQHGIKLMKKGDGGSIINVSSIDGMIGEVDLAAYCASKGGVRSLTKAAALDCARAGYKIRVNSVHPGYVLTPQLESHLQELGSLEDELRSAVARHPIGRIGEPQDVAYGVLYLASDESRFLTGSELVIDGGYTAQ